MMYTIGRRDVLRWAAAIAAGVGLAASRGRGQGQAKAGRPLKALQANMLPKELADAQKFALAKKCGFEGIEMNGPIADLTVAKALGAEARAAGVPIHAVVNGGWDAPLSDPKPEVTARGIAGMETALRSAKALGADAVLLVPALVT
jgi:L-ribulose-5-phosphate 3-epimerase